MNYKQYEIILVNLEPSIGAETKKTRPCVILSPNEMNKHLKTLIIAPLTSTNKAYPTRVKTNDSFVMLDQIKTIDKRRAVKTLGALTKKSIRKIKITLKEMLVDD